MRASSKKLVATLLATALCLLFVLAAHADEPGKRGDYPQCQKACVITLERRMTEISEDYEKKRNKLLYQERVEQARDDYDGCIDKCKQPMPVK